MTYDPTTLDDDLKEVVRQAGADPETINRGQLVGLLTAAGQTVPPEVLSPDAPPAPPSAAPASSSAKSTTSSSSS